MPTHGAPGGAQQPPTEGILECITVREDGHETRAVHNQSVESSPPCLTPRAGSRCNVLVSDLEVVKRGCAWCLQVNWSEGRYF